MDPILKKLEAIAGTPKTLRALSIPITSAASETEQNEVKHDLREHGR